MGPKLSDEFGPVPDVFDFAKTDAQRKVMELHFRQSILGRPLAASPNLSKERLGTLRRALIATTNDSDFLAEARKFNLEIDVATSDVVERLLVDFARFPKPVVEAAK